MRSIQLKKFLNIRICLRQGLGQNVERKAPICLVALEEVSLHEVVVSLGSLILFLDSLHDVVLLLLQA
jgi:hypothetical protein